MLSIVITHYRSPELLASCLDSVVESTRGLDAETLVCDSAALPETKTLVETHAANAAYISFEDNVGYGRLFNAGVLRSRGDNVLIINADTRLNRAAIDELSSQIGREDVGVVGPQLVYENGETQRSAYRFYTPLTVVARRTPLGKTAWGKKDLSHFQMEDVIDLNSGTINETALDVGWVLGACLMTRRDVLSRVGVMDPRFFMYFEDVDWCRRIWDCGYRVVYDPKAQIVHALGGASRTSIVRSLFNEYTRTHMKSALVYFRKHGISRPKLKS